MIVVAHPDDEIIGAGFLLVQIQKPTILHTTNGSPRDPGDAHRSGFATREEYAAARRKELACALEVAGITEEQCSSLEYVDQETMLQLAALSRKLAEVIRERKPDMILTHPYEGGHPDHDSTAFAVHAATKLLSESRPEVYEMTSYHSRNGALETGVFLGEDEPCLVIEPDEAQRGRKEKMFRCFASQQEVLRYFPIGPERFRRAPQYDFGLAPHEGTLNYETLPWGITGQRWRELAVTALQELGLS